MESGKYIELDCPHYVHDYEYGRISEEIKSFFKDKVDDSIMRILSKEIASELMEITFGDNG